MADEKLTPEQDAKMTAAWARIILDTGPATETGIDCPECGAKLWARPPYRYAPPTFSCRKCEFREGFYRMMMRSLKVTVEKIEPGAR